ncbi:MFS transporter [Adlercreutzia sp. R21]|uniref:MFS transporter n=1 Tax=Adlercreutzia wanghongyangiae TaxID=3111451 RepID=UPI002DB8288A|nr:MFS transporter [Adlercreutzia sp. R21]MEC4183966.1 MFS transporter [Adlercreutzia sp. R21]
MASSAAATRTAATSPASAASRSGRPAARVQAKPAAPACAKPTPQPLWTRNFVAGTFLNFFIAGNYFMLMVVMTAYALTVYEAPAAVAAFCASAFIVGTLFSRFTAAPLMERFGRMPLLIVGCIAEVALTALYLLNEPIGALIGVRLVHGFAYGVCSTTVATVITSVVPPERKGEGIGYFMLSITLGSAIGPFAGIFLANNFGYPVVFTVASVLVAASIPAALLLRPGTATKVKGSSSRAVAEVEAADDAAAAVLAAAPVEEAREDAAAVADGPRAVSTPAAAADDAVCPVCAGTDTDCPACSRVPSTHLEEVVTAKVEHSPLARFVEAGVLPIAVVCGLLFFGYSSLLTFLTPYATEIGLARAASVFFVVYALAMFITRPFTGRAFDRVGPHPVMVPAFASFVAGMAVLAFAANDWMILGAAALLGFGVGTVQSCGLAMAVRVTSDARLSVANATFYMLLDVGVGIGPILLGLVAPLIGYANLYLAMAVVGAAALALFMVVAKTEKGVR